MDKKWVIAERECDDLVDQVLINRSIIKDLNDKEARESFVNPDFNHDLHDPSLLPGYEKFIHRIKKAKENKEVVGIFADYDADGTPGAALLAKTLKKIGIGYEVYIPLREDGYGLSKKGIDYLIEHKCSLIISIDLGTRNIQEAEYCAEKNVDLIITDHHLPGDEIPKCLAVINPKIPYSRYPFKDLSGCGVVYKLIYGLKDEFAEITTSFLKWNLDLAAISTICDMVPLVGENRVIAKYGILVLRKTKNMGLKELYKAADIDSAAIDAYTVGFQIGPRINSPGRIDRATKAYELLITDDQKDAEEQALWLNQKNIERQEQMERVYNEAMAQIEKEGLLLNPIIIAAGDWPRGVLGPPASQISSRLNRPVILFAKEDEFVGSARSIEGVNIMDLIEQCSKEILRYGGHKGAAGLSVATNNFKSFKKCITKVAADCIRPELFTKTIKIDCEVSIEELDLTMCRKLNSLEPFGLGNPRPIFMLCGVEFKEARYVGATKKHLSSRVCHGVSNLKSIFFNCASEEYGIQSNTLYDIIFTPSEDSWNGKSQVSLNLKDVRAHGEKE